MAHHDLSSLSGHVINAWDRLRDWAGLGASEEFTRVSESDLVIDQDEADELAPDQAQVSREELFRSRVHRHQAHPLQMQGAADFEDRLPAHEHTSEHEAGTARGARDPMGRGMAARMLSSALGSDPDAEPEFVIEDFDDELGTER